jgi:ankyrin repeat protein
VLTGVWSLLKESEIEHGAITIRFFHCDRRYKENAGRTALMTASQFGYTAIVRKLIEVAADSNLKNNTGATALMFAAINGHNGVVKDLLEAGADISVSDNQGKTAMDWGREKNRTHILQLLKSAKPCD